MELRNSRKFSVCLCCGNELTQMPKQKRKFYSTACKIQWHNKNEAVNKGKIIAIRKKCGREFYAFPSKQRKYCSRECYDKMRCENEK